MVQHESGLCKNLLQEYAQKHGHPLPRYNITREGHEHSLMFSAKVEIAGVLYSGGAAKSKKEAEIKAARTALCAIEAAELQGEVTNFLSANVFLWLYFLPFLQPDWRYFTYDCGHSGNNL